MKKRGEIVDVARAIQDMILALLVGAMLFTYVGLQKDTSASQSLLIAEDVAQVASALDSAPGPILTSYKAPSSIPLKDFEFMFDGNSVLVNSHSAPILATKDADFKGKITAAETWNFHSEGNVVETGTGFSPAKIVCVQETFPLGWSVGQGSDSLVSLTDQLKGSLKSGGEIRGQANLVLIEKKDANWPKNSIIVSAAPESAMMANACSIFNEIVDKKVFPTIGNTVLLPAKGDQREGMNSPQDVVITFINPSFLEDRKQSADVIRAIVRGAAPPEVTA